MFYHLTRSSLPDTAAGLLGRAAKLGWRVMLRGPSRAALERLDEQLWLGDAEGFLPHGLEGGPQDADQPVLLGQGAATNGARALMAVEGAPVDATEALAMERVWVLFDGNSPDALAAARAQWKALTGAGLPAQYWSEEGGRWEKKAERGT